MREKSFGADDGEKKDRQGREMLVRTSLKHGGGGGVLPTELVIKEATRIRARRFVR